MAPLAWGVCEAWSNALMLCLFNQLQKQSNEGVGFDVKMSSSIDFTQQAHTDVQASWLLKCVPKCCRKVEILEKRQKKKSRKRQKRNSVLEAKQKSEAKKSRCDRISEALYETFP